jgi:hypothetical protein
MISCEEFENLYPFEQIPEVLEHKKHCPYCSQYSEEISFIRNSAAALPALNAPNGFEMRLLRRIKKLDEEAVKEWRLLPRAMAFATGVALVLIAGAIYHNNRISKVPGEMASNTESETPPVLTESVVDSSVATPDTAITPQKTPWEKYWNIEMVNAQP